MATTFSIDKNGNQPPLQPPEKKSLWEKVKDFFAGGFSGDSDWDFFPDFGDIDFGDHDGWD